MSAVCKVARSVTLLLAAADTGIKFWGSNAPKNDMPLFDFYIMVDWSGGARRRADRSDTILPRLPLLGSKR